MNDPWNSVSGRPELSIDPFAIKAEDVASPAPVQTRTQAPPPGHRPPVHRQEPSAPLADIEAAQAWANGTGPAPTIPSAPSPSVVAPPAATSRAQMTPPTPPPAQRSLDQKAPTQPTIQLPPTPPQPPTVRAPAPSQAPAPATDTLTEITIEEPSPEADSGPRHRFYSPASFLMLQTVMFFGGLALAGLSAADGEYLPAAIGVFLVGFALFSFGWTDIEPGIVSQEKIGRKTVTHGNDVAGIELDFDKSRHTKWWYPTLVLHNGEDVQLKTLRSVSKTKTEQKARIIQAALNGADIFVSPEERAAGTSAGPTDAPDPDVFTPLPGLEHHYN